MTMIATATLILVKLEGFNSINFPNNFHNMADGDEGFFDLKVEDDAIAKLVQSQVTAESAQSYLEIVYQSLEADWLDLHRPKTQATFWYHVQQTHDHLMQHFASLGLSKPETPQTLKLGADPYQKLLETFSKIKSIIGDIPPFDDKEQATEPTSEVREGYAQIQYILATAPTCFKQTRL